MARVLARGGSCASADKLLCIWRQRPTLQVGKDLNRCTASTGRAAR